MRCFILLTAVFFSACGGGGGTGALENTKELCRDGLDNDNDGFEDCSDQDCWQFVVCLDAATDEGEKEAASDVWYADADGADFSKEYEEVFLFEEDVFIGGCDPCGYGTLTGVVCAPNGKDAVPDALVWIDALDCEGKPVHLETKSLYTGVYKLDGVPCGAQTINISKGSFSHKFNFYVNKELVNDTSSASGDRCLEKDAAKILVLWGQWDTFEGILDELGFAYDYYNFKYEFYEDVPWEEIEAVNLLRDPEGLKKYDIVFMNCASWPDEIVLKYPEITQNIKAFVEAGGSLYMSDLSYVYGEAAWSQAIDFMGNDGPGKLATADGPQQMEGNQSVWATINDGNLGLYTGKTNFTAKFDEGPLIVVDAAGAGTTVHVVGYIKQFKKTHPLVLSYSPGPEAGRVIYTTFHNDAQADELMQKILYYLVFLL